MDQLVCIIYIADVRYNLIEQVLEDCPISISFIDVVHEEQVIVEHLQLIPRKSMQSCLTINVELTTSKPDGSHQ